MKFETRLGAVCSVQTVSPTSLTLPIISRYDSVLSDIPFLHQIRIAYMYRGSVQWCELPYVGPGVMLDKTELQ